MVHAIADLAEQGWRVLLQVRYRRMVRGCIPATFKSSWADRHAVHSLFMDKSSVDFVCVCCPDTKKCYYVDPKREGRSATMLRVAPTANNQRRGVRWADDFLELT